MYAAINAAFCCYGLYMHCHVLLPPYITPTNNTTHHIISNNSTQYINYYYILCAQVLTASSYLVQYLLSGGLFRLDEAAMRIFAGFRTLVIRSSIPRTPGPHLLHCHLGWHQRCPGAA